MPRRATAQIKRRAVDHVGLRRRRGLPAAHDVPTIMIGMIIAAMAPCERARVAAVRDRAGGQPRANGPRQPTRCAGFARREAGRRDHAAGAVERALAQLEAEQAVALERAGQRQFAGLAAPRSRSGHNRARRRAGSPRHGRAPRGRQRVRISAAPTPSRAIDRQRADQRAAGADVPQPQRRPAAGARPRRRGLRRARVRRAGAGRCAWRLAPKQASSSASRAATSEARSQRIANGAASGVRATGVFRKAVMARQSSLPTAARPAERCQQIRM